MSIESGGGASEGASDEERAEAEKFNEMVDEGKLTPAEMAEVEKDKTPEEVEAEKVAMEKVVDPSEKNYFLHSTTSGYLEDKFKHGLVSSLLAVRARNLRIDVPEPSKSFRSSSPDAIYVIDPRGDPNPFTKFPAFPLTPYRNIALIIDRKGVTNPVLDQDYRSDKVVAYKTTKRVRSESVIGLVIHLSQELNTSRSDHKRILEIVQKHKVPVYSDWGDLLWPRRMTHEQVKQFVVEREAKKKAEAEQK